ncbi:MAG: hypothetical protein R3C68_02635 [Myxococcota bacterium]
MAIYGLYAQRAWGLGSDCFQGRIAYLRDGTTAEWLLGSEALERAEEHVRLALRMREQSREEIQPFPAGAAGFALSEDLEKCARCVFRRVCGRD